MRSVLSKTACIVVFTLLVGCQSTANGPQFVEQTFNIESNALIYIYSDYGYTGISTPSILVDGKRIGSLASSGYLYKEVAPGSYSIEVPKSMTWDLRTSPLRLTVEAGNKYFVKYFVRTTGSDIYPTGIIDTHFNSKLELIPSNQGAEEINLMKLSK